TINEDDTSSAGTLISSLITSGGAGYITDVDAGALEGLAITAADVTNGTWQYTIDGGTTWIALGAVSNSSARLLAADANTRIRFVPNADFNGTIAAALTFRAWDRTSGTNGNLASTATNGGTTAFSSATDSASQTVTAVNDAPVNSVPGAQTIAEDTTLTFNTANTNKISVADVDIAETSGGKFKITLSVGDGTVSLSGISGLIFTTGDGTTDALMVFTGLPGDVNAALDGLRYYPTSNANGDDTLSLTSDDQGNTGSGGFKTDLDTVTIHR